MIKIGRKRAIIGAVVLIAAGVGVLAAYWYIQSHPRVTRLDLSLEGIAFNQSDDEYGYSRPRSARSSGPRRHQGLGFSRPDRQSRDRPPRLYPYVGLGVGKVKMSMNLNNSDLDWNKDKSSRRARAFTGFTYDFSPDLQMGLEYRAVATGDPMFELDLGGLDLEVDNPFSDHLVNLQFRYRL